MKLKNILLASVAAGALIAGSSVFADGTLTLKSKTIKVIYLKCGTASTFLVDPFLNIPVSYTMIYNTFLQQKNPQTCHFSADGTNEIGSGEITLTGLPKAYTSATLSNITASPGYTVTHTGTDNLTITLNKS